MLKNPSTSKIDKYYQDKEEKLEKIFVKDIRSRKNTRIYMVVNATKIKDKKKYNNNQKLIEYRKKSYEMRRVYIFI